MKRWFWLLIGLLLIISMSCRFLPGRATEDDDQPETAVTAVVVPEDNEDSDDGPAPDTSDEDDGPAPDTSDEDEGLMIDSDALDQLSSYRATIAWRTEKADGTVESFQMEQWATRDPSAQRFIMESEDGDVEFIQIGSDTWMRFGTEWMQTSSESESDFADILSGGDDWISSVEDGDSEYVGQERVNDINTRHYRVKYNAGLLNWFDESDGVDTINEGMADVWIADEPDLPRFAVKYAMELEGSTEGAEIKMTMTQDVYDINQPFTIEAPEGVGGLPDDVPVYPGATDLTSMTAFTMFSTVDDVATVTEFYEEALSDAGWQQQEDGMVSDEMVSTSWEKDGTTLSLMITSGSDGTSVMISVEE
jgi:hypothetical protein